MKKKLQTNFITVNMVNEVRKIIYAHYFLYFSAQIIFSNSWNIT